MATQPYSGPDTDLQPDARAIAAFLGWWFEFCTKGQIEIGWLDPSGRGLIHFQRFDLGSQEIVPSIVSANLVLGQATYFRASTIRPRYDGFTTDADFVQSPGVWSDTDTPEQMERAKNVHSIVRPNGSVTTGTVPHDRVQAFFRTSEPIISPKLVKSLNQRIFKLYGGDPAVVNPTRLMRLPGTIAWPWKPERVPELTTFAQTTERQASYPLSLLTSQLPADDESSSTSSEPNPGERATLNNVGELIRLIKVGINWHSNMIRVVAHWIGRGWSNQEILTAAESFTLPGYTAEQTNAEVLQAIEGGRKRWDTPDPTHEAEPHPQQPDAFPATPLSSIDLDAIPPRRWVYGRELVRGYVSVLASPGGVGKTAYGLCVGVSVALSTSLLSPAILGKSPLNCVVHDGGKVWIYNLEDPLEEMRRRVKAVLKHYVIPKASVEDKLFVDSGRDRPLVVALRARSGDLIASPVVDLLVEELKRHNITLLIIDPLVQSHSAEENRNDEMNMVMALWGKVANDADCSVWLVHHFRKGGVGGDAESVRGAGSIQGAARSMFTISVMTKEEAEKFGILEVERWQYIRHDNVKSNMAPPAANAIWYKLVSVSLENGTPLYQDGDIVQTVISWIPPNAWGDMVWELVERILLRIDSGLGDGEFYSQSRQSKERWAGNVVVEEACKTESQAFAIIKVWKESGVLTDGQYKSPHQKGASIGCLRLNQTMFSEMRRDNQGGFTSHD